jgi:DNA-binding helix-hairpin-helix protein with protein kinase domain
MKLRRVSNNNPIQLGRELGRGGEGAVFPVIGMPDLVAKIYLKPPAPLKVEKLRGMARRASPALLRVAAWPVDVLGDETGTVRGFLMPKVSAREDVHELYSPKSRRRAFPGVDFRFLARVAANIARAFAQVHAVGNVIGDVNHGNALVGRDGTVVLIDCDSFQIRDGVRMFTCDVGVPLFTPPELAGQAFRGLKRSANHDAFGLAVLLFHLLYLGRHPFAGKHADGEMPIERAIAESRFVYGANAAQFGMSRPPGTLALGIFGEDIARLFESAFAPPGEMPRPLAAQWIDALHALETRLSPCGVSPSHYYPGRGPGPGPDGGDPGCCWCVFEHHTGLRLFAARKDTFDTQGNAKLAPLWDAITAVPPPERAQPLEVPDFIELETKSRDPLGPVPRAILSWVLVFLSGAAVLYQPGEHVVLAAMTLGAAIALRWWYRNASTRTETFQAGFRALLAARNRLARLVEEWNAIATDQRFDQRFERLLGELQSAKDELLALPARREERIKALFSTAAQQQQQRYLDQIRLDKAKLPNVSTQEISMLAAYDVDTAAEVLNRGASVQGLISGVAFREMMAWANACARNFQFDPARAADPEIVAEIDATLLQQQEELLGTLRGGQAQLEALSSEISSMRAAKQRELAEARRAVAEAEGTKS